MEKMEHLGCRKSVVGLVIPTGYSFNLDGTAIYMTMATIFMAQVSGVHLSMGDTLSILALLLVTSKGAAAVTGGGFITLAATLTAIPAIPVAGLALLVGVDRFMSEARAITNLIGNTVATVVIARWDGALDLERARFGTERRRGGGGRAGAAAGGAAGTHLRRVNLRAVGTVMRATGGAVNVDSVPWIRAGVT